MNKITVIPPYKGGLISKLAFQWKSLHLPWRKKWYAGQDLDGNTYWEFKISGGSKVRDRRIIEYRVKDTHLGDINICPQWIQWLRKTRSVAPSVDELIANQERIERLRLLDESRKKQHDNSISLSKSAIRERKRRVRM